MSRRKKRKNGNGSSFVMITRFMMNSEAWKALTPEARCIYFELRKRFNGANNGEIPLSRREAAETLHGGKSNAGKFFQELEEKGFIKSAIKGRFRNRFASTWILTNEEFNGQRKTDEWVHWKPTQNASKNKKPVLGNGQKVPGNGLNASGSRDFSALSGTETTKKSFSQSAPGHTYNIPQGG